MSNVRPPSKQPIPPHATCVFKGVIFSVYQWEQKDYEGNIRIFEKLTRPDTASIIPITEEGKIIYAHQEQPGDQPYIGSIGGRVDEGEDALMAAQRELREETGYEASEWFLLEAIQPAPKIDWCVYMFVARGCRRVGNQSLDGGEKIELRFATFEEYLEVITADAFDEQRLKEYALQAKLDPKKMEAFRKALLGS